MVILTVDQMRHLRAMATAVVNEMSRQGAFKEGNISLVESFLRDACAMGREIALDEARSTPWEYLTTLVATGPQSNSESDRLMNELSGAGWDLHMGVMDRLIWRRRKEVK